MVNGFYWFALVGKCGRQMITLSVLVLLVS